MVKKIDGEYFLTRVETIEYLSAAYSLVWCMTKWEFSGIGISYQFPSKKRGSQKFNAYKCARTKIVRLCKTELDAHFLSDVSS